ncbi:MAG TPA: Clp protease N-terminal domain-containing protein [Actinocrinis sp.]|nr:Clp protease N-terminal domain-containing protein [Actinocrinis sp.]
MLERFTPEARGALTRAAQEAGAPQRRLVDTEHWLLALVTGDSGAEGGGIAFTVLQNAGFTADGVRADIERLSGAPEPLLSDEEAEALRAIGIDADAVLARIEESFGPDALAADPDPARPEPRRGLLGRRTAQPGGRTRFSDRGKKVLGLAVREAQRLHHDYIGTEHLLLGLIREGDGLAMKIITDAGSSADELRAATVAALPKA